MDSINYRVFISYSSQDESLVEAIANILDENGLMPMWDKNFAKGQGFHDQIKNYIAHAHVFLPVITPFSNERKWVHQEIGYALALNIPVLPIASGAVPGQMIEQIQAIKVDNDLQALRKHLTWREIANLVQQYSNPNLATYQCAEFTEDRAAMMANYCKEVKALGYLGLIRQKGALSSFHIPDKSITNSVWKARYGGIERSHKHCQLQLEERRAMSDHATEVGCKLIINPYLTYDKYGKAALKVRLECLLEFLNSMSDEKCRLAFNPEMDHNENVTILGDWFAAESVSARIGQGYRQTNFSRHAPSMLSKINMFDQEFNECLDALQWNAENSRSRAIAIIQDIVDGLK